MYFPTDGSGGEYPVVEAEGELVLVPKNYFTLYVGTVDIDFDDDATINRIEEAVPRMRKTMEKEIGVAIASVQVGLRDSFFILDSKLFQLDDEVYCNPSLEWHSEPKRRVKEACLSHPDVTFYRDRSPHCIIKYQTITGKPKVLDTRKVPQSMYKQILAQAIQHEMDHLKGVDIRDGKKKTRYDSSLD